MIQIKRNNANLLAVDNPLSSSNYSKAVMGEEQITLVWEQPTFLQLNIGDYIVYEGSNFTMNQIPTVKKLSSRLYQYNAVFQSTKYELAKAMYMLFDNTDTIPLDEFPLTGTAETFMQLLIDNLNRVAGAATWSLGDVIPGTEYKNLTFSDEDCLTVLGRLADEFATEYHVINHTIHLKKISTDREITLEYGSTLYDIERSSVNSSDIVTRLYVFGSSKNIAANYRGGSTKLLLPAPDTYLQHANAALYGIIEQSKTFDDIYPRLSSGAAGTVTSVGNEFTFTDSHLDFNVNDCLLDGTKAKVRFNTGECAGYDFEIASYNNATKTYIIIANTGEKDFTLPTADLKPAIGDKYILIDLVMPANYVTSGELEVKDKGLEYLNANATPKVNYKATFSAVYAKQHVQNIECGDTVPVVDTNIGINERLRIVKITKGLTDFYNVQFDLSNTVTKTPLQRIAGDVANVTNQVVVTNDQVNKNRLQAYQNTREVKDMVFDPDGYFDTQKIKPASIETGMLSVGTKSQSFQLACTLQPNYLNNPQVITWSAGTLAHFTLVDDQIKEWVISEGSLTIATQYATSALYIYARCSKTGATGDIYFSTTATKFDADGTNWMFLIGLLHTPINGVRGISLSYGETTINGANIKTGVISGSGLEINLVTGIIKGQVQFKSGETYKEVGSGIADAKSEAIQLAYNDATTKANSAKDTAINTASADATNKANTAYANSQSYINSIKVDLQSQIDGNITSWFYDYEPSVSNVPASNWNPDSVRDIHLGDLFYWTSKGWAYRYQKISGVYSWTKISDTDITKALNDAATAQTIANGKRTTFSVQPTTPYLVSDLWLNNGDLYSCVTARTSGAFVGSDWTKAVKYTDDTAVNNLQIGGRNIIRNSSRFTNLNGWSSNGSELIVDSSVKYDGYNTLRISNPTASGINTYTPFRLKPNSKYTISAYVRCNQDYAGSYDTLLHMQTWTDENSSNVHQDTGITSDNSLVANVWRKVQATFSTPNSPTLCYGVFYFYPLDVSMVINIAYVKLEEGTKATDWTPSAEDVEADATAKANAAQTAAISTAATAAQAKADLAELNAKAHADGIVTAEEQRAINDATTKANNAQTAAINAAAVDATAKANAAQTAAISTAATAISNIKVGGKNLLKDSLMVNGGALSAGIRGNGGGVSLTVDNTILYNGSPTLRVVGGSGFFMAHYPKLQSGVDYTVSMMIKADSAYSGNGSCPLHIQVPAGSHDYESIGAYDMAITTGWRQIWKTFKSTSSSDTDMTIYLYGYSASCNVAWIKLELGNKPTDWTEAPEDDYVKKAIKGSASINGGLVLGNVMAVTDENGNMTAGMSGFDDNIAFWGGGTYQQATDSATNPSAIPVIDRKDGSGHRAFGKMLWDKFGVFKMIGGYIGNFLIRDNSIVGMDSSSVERIRFTTEQIPAVGSLLSPSWTAAADGVINAGYTEDLITDVNGNLITQQQLVITADSLPFIINNAADVKLNDASGITTFAPTGTQSLITGDSYEFWITNGTVYNASSKDATITSVPAGTYTAHLRRTITFNGYAGKNIVYRASSNVGFSGVSILTLPYRTLIGSNGFCSLFGLSKFFHYRADTGLTIRDSCDIPAGLGGATVTSAGNVSGIWGKITSGSQISKSGNNVTITHNIGDTDYTIIPIADSANIPYKTSKTANTIVIVCAGGFDFILVRTK